MRVKVPKGPDATLLLLGGAPILDKNGKVEPIASAGPMVMNTKQVTNFGNETTIVVYRLQPHPPGADGSYDVGPKAAVQGV